VPSLHGASNNGANSPGDPNSTNSKTYSFVSLPGNAVRKRPRRRYDEIERLYACSWPDCNKAYGTLNHLNAHVSMQRHGAKRSPAGKQKLIFPIAPFLKILPSPRIQRIAKTMASAEKAGYHRSSHCSRPHKCLSKSFIRLGSQPPSPPRDGTKSLHPFLARLALRTGSLPYFRALQQPESPSLFGRSSLPASRGRSRPRYLAYLN